MAAVKTDWTLIEHEIRKAEVLGDPMAPLLRVLLEARRDGVTEETLARLSYEAAAGARTEVRKLVEIEVRRQWTRIIPWLLAAAVLGFCMGWLSHSAHAQQLSCRDTSVLDTAKRIIADGKLSDQIRHSQWGTVVGVPNAGNGICGAMQCWGMLAGHPYCFGWRMYGGQVYVQAREY